MGEFSLFLFREQLLGFGTRMNADVLPPIRIPTTAASIFIAFFRGGILFSVELSRGSVGSLV
jgi:hypothetical protein